MQVNPIVILLICIFVFIPLFAAEIARTRSVPTIGDFFLQDRKLGLFPMYATVFATWMSAFAFMGGVAYFYEQGPIYMTTIGWDALFAVLFFALGRRIWLYGKYCGCITPGDFFYALYGSKALELTVTGIAILFTMIYIQVQMVGGLVLIQVATDGYISWQVSGLILFSNLVIYLWAGGLRAVILTDMFYGALIIVTILGCGFFLMHTAGGIEDVFQRIVADDIEHVTLGGAQGADRLGRWITLFLIVPIGAFMGPQMWIRNYAAGSERHFERLPFMLCLSSIICIGTLFAGSAGILLNEKGVTGDILIAVLMLDDAEPLLCTFVFLGIAAACLSTANSQIHALATIYTMDIHKKYMNRNIPERKLLSVAKWSVLLISAAAYVLILVIPQSIFDLGVIAMGGMAQLIVPVAGALFWNRSTTKGALFSLWSGIASFFLLLSFSRFDASYCAVFGLLLNAAVFLAAGFINRKPSPESEKLQEYQRIASSFFHKV